MRTELNPLHTTLLISTAIITSTLISPQASFAGAANPDATFVLHAQIGLTGTCTASGQPDCINTRPTVNVQPDAQYRVFFYLNNVEGASGVQTAFQWDPSWDLLGSSWNCQNNSLTIAVPDADTDGGPTAGALLTTFECVTGPGPVLIGYMDFLVGSSGSLFQVNPTIGSQRVEVVDCLNLSDQFDANMELLRLGRISVAAGGRDACDPPPSTPPPPPLIGTSHAAIDFGCVPVGGSKEIRVNLSNVTPDPNSLLHVTHTSIDGTNLGLTGPTLPLIIPGDGTTIPLSIQFSPSVEGPVTGTLTVIASNAPNSPHTVPISGTGCPAVPIHAFSPDQFLVNFSQNAVIPPPNFEGPLDVFRFAVPGLRDALQDAGVFWLRKLFRDFDPEDINATNTFGEDIVLDDLSRIYVARLLEGSDVVDAVDDLGTHPGVDYVEPDYIYGTASNDQFFYRQWGLHNTGQLFGGGYENQDINAPEAWDRYSIGAVTRVGVIDTGVYPHPELNPRLRDGWNYLDPGASTSDDSYESHGTAVAGIIAATGNNSFGMAGVSWTPEVWVYKTHDANRQGLASNIANAIYDANDHIVNMSFAGPNWSQTIYLATRGAANNGYFLVAAMGNEPNNTPQYPAAHDYTVFSVGAMWASGQWWRDSIIGTGCPTGPGPGSAIGSWIDVCAPGGRAIVSLRQPQFGAYYALDSWPPNISWCQADGYGTTSAAAAFVSGVAALLKGFTDNGLSNADLAEVLERTALNRDIPEWDERTGWGLVRADEALEFVSPPRIIQRAVRPTVSAGTYNHEHQFSGYGPTFPNGAYDCIVHRQQTTYSFPTSFTSAPDAWYRMSGTQGHVGGIPGGTLVSNFNNEPVSYAEITSISAQSISLTTYVHEVYHMDGGFVDWWPTTPAGARIGFTAIGPGSVMGLDDHAPSVQLAKVRAAPNPASGAATFLVDLPHYSKTSLRIYDLAGRLVRILSDEPLAAGRYNLQWDGQNTHGRRVATGVYFWQLDVNGEQVKRDKLVIKR